MATTSFSLKNAFGRVVEHEENRVSTLETKIELLSPDTILKRGYSISVKDGVVIKGISDIKESDNIKVIFADGEAEAEVKNINRY